MKTIQNIRGQIKALIFSSLPLILLIFLATTAHATPVILDVRDIDTPGADSVLHVGGLTDGARAFNDRPVFFLQNWINVPQSLEGADYIESAQNNADVSDDRGTSLLIEVDVAEGAVLYMFIDENQPATPFPWMNFANFGADWVDTGLEIFWHRPAHNGFPTTTQIFQIWRTAGPLDAGTYNFRQMPVDSSFYIIAATFTTVPLTTNVLLISGGSNDNAFTRDVFCSNIGPGACPGSGFTFTTHHVNTQGIPTLAQLQQYDVVLLWENGLMGGTLPQQTGDVVAQYVQEGGNLIIGTFYWQDRSENPIFNQQGWGSLENIDPFTSIGGSEDNNDNLDAGSKVAHPLTDKLFSMSGFFHGGVAAKFGTTVVAQWSDGVPLIGFSGDHCIIGISHFPAHDKFINVTGDFYQMWESAIIWAAASCKTDSDPVAVVIDEDSIDNGSPPNFFFDFDVNDDIAALGLRAQLPVFAANVGETITLHTGEVGDEGWFALTSIPDAWAGAGPTNDGLLNYVGEMQPSGEIEVGDGLGRGNDPEALLDKIPGVTPLRATGLEALVGQQVCAVVQDSDVSINYDPLDGSLKGDSLGLVAFKVLSVTPLTGESSSSLPEVEVEILDADEICEGDLGLFVDAPVPDSSSEPFDTGH